MKTRLVITSKKNPNLLLLQKLSQKKYRRQAHAFIVEGLREINDALVHNFAPLHLFYDQHQPGIIEQLVSIDGLSPLAVASPIMASLSSRGNHHPIVAIFSQKWGCLATEHGGDPADFWIALDAPKKPNNVGAVIRTAEAAGAKGIILLDDFCDPYSPESVRASTGAILTIPLIATTSMELVRWSLQHQIELIGTSIVDGVDYRHADYTQPTVMVMGTEYEGLSSAIEAKCHQRVTIPMRGETNSLNLAVASGILLYQISNSKHCV